MERKMHYPKGIYKKLLMRFLIVLIQLRNFVVFYLFNFKRSHGFAG